MGRITNNICRKFFIIHYFYTFAYLKCRDSKNLVITFRVKGMKFYKV